MIAVCECLHLDPWRVMDEWTWPRFWVVFDFLKEKSERERKIRRQQRAKAGLEKPRLIDSLRNGLFGKVE